MADKVDFLIEYIGGLDPLAIDNFAVNNALKLQIATYQRLKTRTLVRHVKGAGDGDLKATFLRAELTNSVVAEMKKAQSDGKTLGQVLITGFSKGAIYAYKLATEIKAGVSGASILYVGLGDMPIMPYGYNPPVPNFFSSIPENEPTLLPDIFFSPPRALNDPQITVTPTFTAGLKKNYFQGKGNGWGPTRNHPHRSSNAFFWWSSQMLGKEVHGKIINDDWVNEDLKIDRELSDIDNHAKGDDEAVKRMGQDVSDALNRLT